MIRMVQSTSAGHAQGYFSDALSKADYYLDDQELQGRYNGRLAKRLGLNGPATKETFFALCANIDPNTDKALTARIKEERTVGYDINFHCPKSVSILHALAKDNHILEAFQDSVSTTMQDIERDSKARVRKSGKYEERETGELIWADFVHQTSRPVDDKAPDPHLHSHCFVFNATWDETEKQFKAGQFRDIKRDMPYYQAQFHKTLSDKLINLGYKVRLTEKSFEIEGVPERVIKLFSKRSDEIGRIAKEKGITDAKALADLGARTRSKKQKGLSMVELKAEWRKQMKDLGPEENGEGEKAVRFAASKEPEKLKAEHCVNHALQHSFERASVIQDRRVLGTAYRYAMGNNSITVDQINDQFKKDSRIIHIKESGVSKCTTKEILSEEKRMIELARSGKEKLSPLYQVAPALKVKDQQAAAIEHILTTKDRVSIIRGAAGTGKTTLMKEAVSHIEASGKKVFVLAPTAQASRGVLKEEGFDNAETVAKFLTDRDLQDTLQGQVLWVDEAGLLGTQDMTKLLEIATKKNARLILGGDTRQHSAVVRGDSLRILNTVGGIKTAEVSKIFRQKNEQYRSAVEDLSQAKVKSGFEKLDRMGAIKTIDPLKPNEELVEDYVNAVKKGKTALVISPTHKQGEEVTDEIRTKLRQVKMIGKKEIKATKLSNLNLTEAQKRDWRNFKEGHVIQFNQNAKGIGRGSVWTVKMVEEGTVQLVDDKNKEVLLPLSSGGFDVLKKGEIGLSKGDKIQVTRNGFDKGEKRLNNGMTLEVQSVKKNGQIILKNTESKSTYNLDADFGHIAHAHCITSYASQGKTVDQILIAQPSSTFPATDARQFYVSVSRGRESVKIYTDDKEALLYNASALGDRQSAMELMESQKNHVEHLDRLNKLQVITKSPTTEPPTKSTPIKTFTIDIDYEPGF